MGSMNFKKNFTISSNINFCNCGEMNKPQAIEIHHQFVIIRHKMLTYSLKLTNPKSNYCLKFL